MQCLVFTVSAELTNVRRRQYVDPSEYDNIQEAVQKFARELDPKMLTLENLIGGGKKKQCTVRNDSLVQQYKVIQKSGPLQH